MPTDQDFTLVSIGDLAAGGTTLATALMTDTCKIGRLVAGSWALQHSGVSCQLSVDPHRVHFVQPLGSAVSLVWQASLPLATDVLPFDQIQCNGQLFVVDDTDRGMTRASCITAYLRRVFDASITWFI